MGETALSDFVIHLLAGIFSETGLLLSLIASRAAVT